MKLRGDKMNYPQIIKFIRETIGYSQEQLARELHVSFATINRWENGKTEPRDLARIEIQRFCENNNIGIKNI